MTDLTVYDAMTLEELSDAYMVTIPLGEAVIIRKNYRRRWYARETILDLAEAMDDAGDVVLTRDELAALRAKVAA